MPRAEFNTPEELLEWATAIADVRKYTVYTTASREIIFEPKTSTSPVRFGYITLTQDEVFQKLIATFRERGYVVLRCGNYIWASDRAPGVMNSMTGRA